MDNNIIAYVKKAEPIDLYTIARQLANCDGTCPARCTKSTGTCNETQPLKCANTFKKWALKKSKEE